MYMINPSGISTYSLIFIQLQQAIIKTVKAVY